MRTAHYLACDLGAESGRLMQGTIENGRLTLQELHRFPNIPIRESGSLRWNIPNLILELKEGLRKAARTGLHFESISTDSWGVDYILFQNPGSTRVSRVRAGVPARSPSVDFEIQEPVFHYRNPRTKRGVENALARVKWEEIFAESGIQFMLLNTLFQLAAEDPSRLEHASFLLGVGDAFNYFLSGTAAIEVSMASTFQLYNPRQGEWSDKLINALGFPRRIFPTIVPSGTRLGKIRPQLATELGIAPLEVIATCSHDTGAAVAGVPAFELSASSAVNPAFNPPLSAPHWAYLSSGTWSLMGVELASPIITDLSRELNFTNEIGYGNTVRLLKNISGLWLIQECKRQWTREGVELDYAELTRRAAKEHPFLALINPAAEEFLAPENMVSQIVQFCRRTNQPAPKTEGAFVRCALESLALLYRRTLRQIEQLTSRKIEHLHVVGGGSNNDLLNQFTANAVQIPVLAGPAEATAAGNVLIQAIALDHVRSLSEAREMIRHSYQLRRFEPQRALEWNEAFARFEQL